jgi:cysteinylglycine-S-conjugate dipeptidase
VRLEAGANRKTSMKTVLKQIATSHKATVDELAGLVAIPSVSTDGKHQKELDRSAKKVSALLRKSGLENIKILQIGKSNPFVYGEWLHAPGAPTIFLYSHHDVQPVSPTGWRSSPWTLTRRKKRLYARGAADDKGAIVAEAGAVAGFLKSGSKLPVNIKMLVEGEEEIGSPNLQAFFNRYKKLIHSDVIVVCDTENVRSDIPCITYSLRGIVEVLVEVESAREPRHSGMAGGVSPDAAIALNVILSRLYSKNGASSIPGFEKGIVPLSAEERQWLEQLPNSEESWRKELSVLDGVRLANTVNPFEQTWRHPSATIIAQEASSLAQKSNQVLPKAVAVVSCRIVPDQNPEEVYRGLRDLLTKDPPWGVKISVTNQGAVRAWMTSPKGPAFEAAMSAMESGFGKKPIPIGCGGSIGFVGPLAELLGGAPALLLGIEDPQSNAHAPNESLDEGILKNLTVSLAQLFENVGSLPDGRVK